MQCSDRTFRFPWCAGCLVSRLYLVAKRRPHEFRSVHIHDITGAIRLSVMLMCDIQRYVLFALSFL